MDRPAPIGGDFALEAGLLAPDGALRPPGPAPWRGRGHGLLLSSGRGAIGHALDLLARRGLSGRVWLPAYACPSVAAPFRARGFELRRYGQGPGLDRPRGLPRRLERGDVLLLIHYFGRLNRALLDYAGRQAERAWVIEDCVQGCLARGLGRQGDFAVHGLRKWLPVPDGALLCSPRPLGPPPAPPREELASRQLLARWLRAADPDAARALALEAEGLLEEDPLPRRASWATAWLLRRLDLQGFRRRRRVNWRRLDARLRERLTKGPATPLHPLHPDLGPGEVPLGYPVVLAEPDLREALRRALAAERIWCPVHWELEPEARAFEADWSLSRRILTLPVDQRLGAAEVDRLAARVAHHLERLR